MRGQRLDRKREYRIGKGSRMDKGKIVSLTQRLSPRTKVLFKFFKEETKYGEASLIPQQITYIPDILQWGLVEQLCLIAHEVAHITSKEAFHDSKFIRNETQFLKELGFDKIHHGAGRAVTSFTFEGIKYTAGKNGVQFIPQI